MLKAVRVLKKMICLWEVGLCHVRCACLAGQKKYNKHYKFFGLMKGDGTELFVRHLSSSLCRVLSLFLSCYCLENSQTDIKTLGTNLVSSVLINCWGMIYIAAVSGVPKQHHHIQYIIYTIKCNLIS